MFDGLGGAVPIGLVSNNWGGTRVEQWIPPETSLPCGHASTGELYAALGTHPAACTRRTACDACHARRDARVSYSNAAKTCRTARKVAAASPPRASCDRMHVLSTGRARATCVPSSAGRRAGGRAGLQAVDFRYNAMIAPYTVGPMAVTGFTWYQGESDLGGDATLPEQNNNYTCALRRSCVGPSPSAIAVGHHRRSTGARKRP